MDQEKFLRDRISELRTKTGVSEYQMSRDLGHSTGYIQSISSGRTFPSWPEFFYMLEYLGVTAKEFFDPELQHPALIHDIVDTLRGMPEDDLRLILELFRRLNPVSSGSPSQAAGKDAK